MDHLVWGTVRRGPLAVTLWCLLLCPLICCCKAKQNKVWGPLPGHSGPTSGRTVGGSGADSGRVRQMKRSRWLTQHGVCRGARCPNAPHSWKPSCASEPATQRTVLRHTRERSAEARPRAPPLYPSILFRAAMSASRRVALALLLSASAAGAAAPSTTNGECGEDPSASSWARRHGARCRAESG